MVVGLSAHTVLLPASLAVGFLQVLRVVILTVSIQYRGLGRHQGVRRQIPARQAGGGDRKRGEAGRSGSPPNDSVARSNQRAIGFRQVMSASVKPRLAGRQPSNRGGVPRVMTRLSSQNRLRRQARVRGDGPPE